MLPRGSSSSTSFGEVMDAVHQGWLGGPTSPRIAGGDSQCALLRHLEKVWRSPDEGIWETRGGRQHFTYSKVMAWVAFDRAPEGHEEIRPRRADGAVALAARRDPSRGLREGVQPQAQRLHPGLRLGGARRQHPPDPRSSDFCRPATSGWPGRLRRSSSGCCGTGSCMRYDTASSQDGMPPGEGCFSPAASGWWTPIDARPAPGC